MISDGIHILTKKDLERERSKWFAKGVERGKFEADYQQAEDRGRKNAFRDATNWFLHRKTSSFSGAMVISALKSIEACIET